MCRQQVSGVQRLCSGILILRCVAISWLAWISCTPYFIAVSSNIVRRESAKIRWYGYNFPICPEINHFSYKITTALQSKILLRFYYKIPCRFGACLHDGVYVILIAFHARNHFFLRKKISWFFGTHFMPWKTSPDFD